MKHLIWSDIDYGFRKYDSFTGRFITADVFFEKYPAWNPYHYSMNNPISYYDDNGYYTKSEKQVSFIHPYSAFIVYNNSKKALLMAQQTGLSGQHNGEGDAFRHTLWNAMNARDIGKVIAKKFGDAHEDFEGNDPSEKNMDLENNRIGREIGEDNSNATDEELKNIILEKIANGELQLMPLENSNNEIEHPYKEKDYNYNGVEDVND